MGRWLGQAEADSRYVNVAGDTMTGALAMGASKITDLATPTAANDAVRKAYADLFALLAGASFTGIASITVANADLLTLVQNLFNTGVAIRIKEAYSGGGGYYNSYVYGRNAHLVLQGNSQVRLISASGSDIKLEPGGSGMIDAQKEIANSTANNNGNVAIDDLDELEMLGNQKGLIVRTSTGARYRVNVSDGGAVQATAL
jgi:hypothetical protein